MRRKTIKRHMVALGRRAFEPTEEQRLRVRLWAFNGVPEEEIASGIGVELLELRYWFAKELRYSTTQIMEVVAKNILELASQREDLGVALRANELVARTRSRAWREPKGEEAPLSTNLESVSTEELERIVRLGVGDGSDD